MQKDAFCDSIFFVNSLRVLRLLKAKTVGIFFAVLKFGFGLKKTKNHPMKKQSKTKSEKMGEFDFLQK